MGMDPGIWVASGPAPVAAAGEGGRFGAAGARRLATTMCLAGDWEMGQALGAWLPEGSVGGLGLGGREGGGLLAVGITHITSPSRALLPGSNFEYWVAGCRCQRQWIRTIPLWYPSGPWVG